jgi:predicted anti-sigma-YlaC factor YlaD
MLTCRQVNQLVTDYLEGKLSLRETLKFQFHLGTCRQCRRYLRQMKRTIRTLGRLPPVEVPAEVMSLLMSRFRQW